MNRNLLFVLFLIIPSAAFSLTTWTVKVKQPDNLVKKYQPSPENWNLPLGKESPRCILTKALEDATAIKRVISCDLGSHYLSTNTICFKGFYDSVIDKNQTIFFLDKKGTKKQWSISIECETKKK